MLCSAAWSIGLSADGRDLVHDNESPVTHPSATPVIRATAGTLSLVFILDRIIPQFSFRPPMLAAQIVKPLLTFRYPVFLWRDIPQEKESDVKSLDLL
jgi:hypothetical protein